MYSIFSTERKARLAARSKGYITLDILLNASGEIRGYAMRACSKLIAALVCLAVFAGQSQAVPSTTATPDTPIYDKWALIIGISKFKDPSLNLKFSAKDARDFYNFLVREGNFAPDHVKLLLNEEASRENVLSSLGDKWLPRVANPNDLVVIYISSHGSPSGMDVGGVNYVVAYDTNKESLFSTGIPMQDLVRVIKGRVHSDRIVLILDACHSGAANADEKAVFKQGNVNVDEIVAGTGQLVISSSMPDQVSWEAKGEPNGVFTKYLIEGLRQKGPQTTLGDAYSFMKDKVQEEVLRERGVLQTPVLKSKWEGKELALLTPPTKPRAGLKETPAEAARPQAQPEKQTGPAVQAPPAVVAAPAAKSTLQPVADSQTTLWNTYVDSARKEVEQRHFLEARKMLAEAQKEADSFPAGDSRRTATLLELADVNFLEGKYTEAEPMYWKVMDENERTAGQDSPKVAEIVERLSGIALKNGKFAEAEKLATRALTILDKPKVPDKSKVAGALDLLADAALGKGEPKHAEALAKQALALRESAPATDERELAKNLLCLSRTFVLQEKFADAEPAAQRALSLSEKAFGADSPETADCLEIYSQVLTKLNRTADARRYDTRAKSLRKKLSKDSNYR